MTSIRRCPIVLGLIVVGIAGVSLSCGDDGGTTPSAKTASANTTSETSAARVDVIVKEFSIATGPRSVKAGEVRFFVKDAGKQQHELVVVKSDIDPAKLPTYSAGDTPAAGHVVGDVDEEKVTSEGEVEGIEPGTTKDATFVLEPGKYVLICNLPAHYGQGMHVALTVG